MQATSIRLDEDTLARLDSLAGSLNCSRAVVIKEAVEKYLEYDAWVRAEVQKGLDAVQAGQTIPHEEMKTRLRRLGAHVD